MLEAALGLAADQPVTLARIYANVLDTLSPSTLHVLRGLAPCGAPDTGAVVVALAAGPADGALDVEQVSALFELSPDLASSTLDLARRGGLTVATAARVFEGRASARLALPGLQHMLLAGDCLGAIARDDPHPPRAVAPAWFPFLRELISESARERLRSWLVEPAPDPTHSRDGAASTILWATGEVPPLDAARRRPWLAHAWLEGVDVPGANLEGAFVGQSRLTGAKLQGARLCQAALIDVALDDARLDGADLTHARLQRASLVSASLRGLRGEHVTLAACDLRRADAEGARLDRATIGACRLAGANLRRVALRDAKLLACVVEDADLGEVDLSGAELAGLDLTKARSFDPATLRQALVSRCDVSGLDLSGLDAHCARWIDSVLSATTLADASLVEAAFVGSRAHEARFDGADLRGARFEAVSFQTGSSRSGLLVGKPALEGSMTGFYIEGTTDDAWVPPDLLRQASFRGADLRGATFAATNLFRVDLRGARLDRRLREQARDHGAILDDC